jgi:cytochrome c oxidase assembly protein subunit 15
MTTNHSSLTTHESPWLHRWAVLTACATFILLLLGAVVTTFRVGMADPIWPTYPWHLLLVSWDEPRPGFLIEHSHRLAGYVVGCCVIVLAVGLWRSNRPRGIRWLGVAALLGVIIQGLLGGFRVKLNRILGNDLALIHGCFAQIVFGLLVSLAVLTGRGWSLELSQPGSARIRLRRLSVMTAILVYIQIVFGAIFRHTFSSWGQRGHLLIAFAVVAATAWLVKETVDYSIRDKRLTISVFCLGALVAIQLFLGVEAWMVRMTAVNVAWQAIIRTAHVLVGGLIFASALATMLQAYRTPIPKLEPGSEVGRNGSEPAPIPVRQREEVLA